jgi:hypothetical protein
MDNVSIPLKNVPSKFSLVIPDQRRNYKGTVQLSGFVVSQKAVDKAGQIAWRVKGDKSLTGWS